MDFPAVQCNSHSGITSSCLRVDTDGGADKNVASTLRGAVRISQPFHFIQNAQPTSAGAPVAAMGSGETDLTWDDDWDALMSRLTRDSQTPEEQQSASVPSQPKQVSMNVSTQPQLVNSNATVPPPMLQSWSWASPNTTPSFDSAISLANRRVSMNGDDDDDDDGTSTKAHKPSRSACASPNSLLKQILASSERGNVADNEGFLPIHLACRHFPDNVKLIGMVLRANPGAVRGQINPPAYSGNGKGMRRMLSDINSRPIKRSRGAAEFELGGKFEQSYDGAYPIHVALVHEASDEVIKLLVRQGPDVLARGDGSGCVPLNLALRLNAREEIISHLLAANPSAASVADERMNYPLHVVCMFRSGSKAYSHDTIKALADANPTVVHESNFNGKTPVELAQENGSVTDETVSYLQQIAYKDDDVLEP